MDSKDKYINDLERSFLQNLIRSIQVNISVVSHSTYQKKNKIINLDISNKILIQDVKERWNTLNHKDDKQFIKDTMKYYCTNDISKISNKNKINNDLQKSCHFWVDMLLKDNQ